MLMPKQRNYSHSVLRDVNEYLRQAGLRASPQRKTCGDCCHRIIPGWPAEAAHTLRAMQLPPVTSRDRRQVYGPDGNRCRRLGTPSAGRARDVAHEPAGQVQVWRPGRPAPSPRQPAWPRPPPPRPARPPPTPRAGRRGEPARAPGPLAQGGLLRSTLCGAPSCTSSCVLQAGTRDHQALLPSQACPHLLCML